MAGTQRGQILLEVKWTNLTPKKARSAADALRDASQTRPASAERMRALRERQRKGLLVVPFQIRDSEIHALVRRGLLDAGLRHDRWRG